MLSVIDPLHIKRMYVMSLNKRLTFKKNSKHSYNIHRLKTVKMSLTSHITVSVQSAQTEA